MFTNLIESQSHRREFKRRSSFFLFTVAAYAVILFGAGIGSIYAYDAQLEAQTTDLVVTNWIPPVTQTVPKPIVDRVRTIRRPTTSTAPVDPHVTEPVRTQGVASTNDPTRMPDKAGIESSPIPPVSGPFRLGSTNVDPPATTTGNGSGDCLGCSSTPAAVVITEKPPEPTPVKPPTPVRLPSTILTGKALSLPQPQYPILAKQARQQGSVSIQILVSEEGKVISAQAVSGSAMLTSAARDAAMRARFSPTVLNGTPVKVQGVINYNFVLQ